MTIDNCVYIIKNSIINVSPVIDVNIVYSIYIYFLYLTNVI